MAVALITGASSGIGEAFARRLVAEGHDVVLVARRRDRLEAIAGEVGRRHGVRAQALPADLLTKEGRDAVAERMGAPPALDFVVNSAGFAGFGPFLERTWDDLEALEALHVRAVAQLTHAAAKAMADAGGGSIVNVSSRLALSATLPPPALPHRAVYVAAKAFQLVLTEALASELGASGVRFQVLLPGVVRTEFHGPGGPAVPPSLIMEPHDVVDASLKALDRGEVLCAPGLTEPSLLELRGRLERAIVMGTAPVQG